MSHIGQELGLDPICSLCLLLRHHQLIAVPAHLVKGTAGAQQIADALSEDDPVDRLRDKIGRADLVAYAVDINPNMRVKYMVATGHQVRAPQDMLDDPVDVVIAMNPVYRSEIAATIEGLGLSARLFTINEMLTTEVAV